MKAKGFSKIALGVFAALTLVGVGCWVFQLANGLGVTGMSNVNSWGAYICMFVLFVGLSAGGLIVASSAHVFGVERFKAVAKPAVICVDTFFIGCELLTMGYPGAGEAVALGHMFSGP